jgi:leucyl-tRNA synthetase
VRDKLEVPADLDETAALERARASAGAKRALEGRQVRNEIARPPRLVNFVTKG